MSRSIHKLLARLEARHPRFRVRELERLLAYHGFILDSQEGSHRRWSKESQVIVLVDHGDAKPYQIQRVRELLR